MTVVDSLPSNTKAARRLPVGAEVQPGNQGVSFRIWAPSRKRAQIVFTDNHAPNLSLTAEGNGYFSGTSAEAKVGMTYRFRLDDDELLYPDPVSRYQPEGPHGPSQIVDGSTFQWTDENWQGVTAHGQVLYEMHIGTFTREGTWAAAIDRLPFLKEVGITCLEVMPVNEFAGKWGWGYDGVNLFAPFHGYGSADDMRRFIDRAHALGIGVILDLVYNHFGPDGNYLKFFSESYFSETHATDWGDAINFDGKNSGPVREFFLSNIRLWIEEYHLDGFRFDATQAIIDDSPRHILALITEQAHASAKGKSVYLINENEPQNATLVRPTDKGGYGMDGMWNDDFHHSAMVALSGHNEAYYSDYFGTPQEMVSAAKWGYLYQGQRYHWQKRRRGTACLDLPPTAFVHFLQNHDQVANSGTGYRAHQVTSPGELKAMTALLLLMPQTPMLFQGQEWAASAPFYYFHNHNPDLAKLIRQGRAKEIAQFPNAATDQMQRTLNDPGAEKTFLDCKLDHSEIEKPFHAQMLQLHKDLLKLRHKEAAFRRVQRRGDIDGAVLGPRAFVLRYFGRDSDDHLVIVNFGKDLQLDPCPEPLMAPPVGQRWSMIWTSEDPRYGGSGTAPVDTEKEGWRIPGRTAVVLRPRPAAEAAVETRHRVEGSAQEAKKREKHD